LTVQLPEPEPELAPAPALTTVAEEAFSPNAVPPAPTFLAPKPKLLRGKVLTSAMAALSQEEFYPREAIKLGLEGKVTLLLHLDPAGHVQAAEVASSSGHAILDAAAVQAAGRITAIAGNARQVLLPVDFRLD
jgi:protein TonB